MLFRSAPSITSVVKTKLSPAIVGLFVLGAFALGILALLSFGGVNIFTQPQRFVVTFNETVHGLDLGSPVKLRGVRVGRVADLSVRYDQAAGRSRVRVVCELTRSKISNPQGGEVDVTSREELEALIGRGLRAQLGVLGLATGLLYVEMDFYDAKLYPPDPEDKDSQYVVMPAVPSTIGVPDQPHWHPDRPQSDRLRRARPRGAGAARRHPPPAQPHRPAGPR